MHLIKKYTNRKLYHTNRKSYITLEGIAELIRVGEQVQVVDNATGSDITATILTQIILQQPSERLPLPLGILTGLIQLGGDALSQVQRLVVNTLERKLQVDGEIIRRLQRLVERGVLGSAEADRIEYLLISHRAATRESTPTTTQEAQTVASKSDLVQLHAELDHLMRVVEQLVQQKHS